MDEVTLYKEAGALAARAMGKVTYKWRGFGLESQADKDPLAWFCLTESIVDLAERYALSTHTPAPADGQGEG